jgi:hypothetical protein
VLRGDVLALVLPLIGASARSCDRDAARTAADLLDRMLTRPDLLAPGAFGAAVHAAVVAHGAGLVAALVAALADDRGALVFGSAADMLRTLFERYGAAGAGAAFAAAVDAAAAADTAARGGGGGGGGGGGDADARRLHMDEQSGAGCLTPDDARGLAALALDLSRRSRPRFRMLISDLARLWRRQATKDTLLAHLLAPAAAGAGGDSPPLRADAGDAGDAGAASSGSRAARRREAEEAARAEARAHARASLGGGGGGRATMYALGGDRTP